MILNYIKVLFNCKYTFLPPKKSEVIIFDEHSIQILSKIFNLKKIEVLRTRKEEINLFILFKNFIRLQFSFTEYLTSYIIFTKAKIIISSIDNNEVFYKFKSKCNACTIFFQNGVRMGHNDIFEILNYPKKLKNIKKNNFVNFMFTFNQMTSDLYRKIINGKTIECGSILSNCKKISFKKRKGIIYISLFRPNIKKKTHINEIKLIQLLGKYCIKNKLQLKILCKFFKNTPKGDEEFNFYKKILKNNFLAIQNKKSRNSYKFLDESKIVVSSGSTMGIESLGRKNKTVIINPFPNINPIKRNFYGYFTKRKNKGFFWYNGINESTIFKTLDDVNNCKISKWYKILKKHEYETMKHDQDNYMLKKNLKKILAKKNIDIKKYLVK